MKRLSEALANCRRRIDEVADKCQKAQALVGRVDECQRQINELAAAPIAQFDGLPTSPAWSLTATKANGFVTEGIEVPGRKKWKQRRVVRFVTSKREEHPEEEEEEVAGE